MTFKKDEQLNKIISNKRIAIVGPSAHLVNSNLGEKINKYDVICRINDVIPTGFEKDFGSRTDIMFCNCATNFLEMMREKIKNNSKVAKEIKLVFCPVLKAVGNETWRDKNEDYVFQAVANFKRINMFSTPFLQIGYDNYLSFYDQIQTEPNAGIISILTLLQYNIKELLITGFSFYSQGSTYQAVYYPGYFPKEYENPQWNPHAGHNQSIQINFLKKYIKNNKKVKIVLDKVLEKVLL